MAFKKKTNKVYDEAALYTYAVESLGRRMRTVAELKRLLRTKVQRQTNGDELIESVVVRLKEQRYLNDSSYAKSYSSYRRENEKFGRYRVVQDLKAKGVHTDVIEKAVNAAYEGVSEEEQARRFVERKRLAKPTDQKQTARIFRMMARAGFSTRTIVQVLKRWNVDDETVSALEQERMIAEETMDEEE